MRCAGQYSFQAFRSTEKIFDNGFALRKSRNSPLDRQMSVKKLLPGFKCQSIDLSQCCERFRNTFKNCCFSTAFRQFQMQRPFALGRFRPAPHALRGVTGTRPFTDTVVIGTGRSVATRRVNGQCRIGRRKLVIIGVAAA